MEAHYLLTSRNSTLLASLKPLEEENFNAIFRGLAFINLRKFLQTLGFKTEEIQVLESQLGCNFDTRYRKLRKTSAFKKLIANQTFRKLYDKKRISSNKAFGAYLSTFGVDFEHDGMIVVDVGWNGTIQDLISKYFGSSVNVSGYYIGSRDKTELDRTHKRGLLYSAKSKKYRGHSMFHHNMAYYEQLLRASHNRVDDYVIKDGIGQAVLDTEIDDEANYHNLIEPMQARITEKFIQICKLDFMYNSAIEGIACDQFYKMITHPTKKDKLWLYACEDTHFDKFARVGYQFRLVAHAPRALFYKLSNMVFKIKFGFAPKKKKAR